MTHQHVFFDQHDLGLSYFYRQQKDWPIIDIEKVEQIQSSAK